MKAHHLSASKVDLALACSYWARGDVDHPHRPPGKAAATGRLVHKASENYLTGRSVPPLDNAAAPLWMTLRAWLTSNGHVASKTEAEIPLLYDAEHDTAQVCEMGEGERDYLGVTAMRVPMRLDLVQSAPTLTVVDIKTGRRSNVAPAAENLQLRTQALAASRAYGIERVRVGLVFPMATKVHEGWAELGPDDLDTHAGTLHRVLRKLPMAEPVRGEWCWRCPIGPSRDYPATCPAWGKEETAA